jgi:hypothetical protein
MEKFKDVITAQHWEVIAGGHEGFGTTPKELWEMALTYFQWCDASPIYKPELIRAGLEAGSVFSTPIPRPYTISGLCLHTGITRDWLYDIAKNKDAQEWYMVATKIIEIIYTQKLEYAITGVFNPVIAAKELGLGNDRTSDQGSPVINIEVVDDSPKLIDDERDVELPNQFK